jgi:hypothetical protein
MRAGDWRGAEWEARGDRERNANENGEGGKKYDEESEKM